MREFEELSMTAARAPVSLGRRIRDEEMWRVTRILNAKPARPREMSFTERYGDRYGSTVAVSPRTPSRARSRIKSLWS